MIRGQVCYSFEYTKIEIEWKKYSTITRLANFQNSTILMVFYWIKSWSLGNCPLIRGFPLFCVPLIRGSTVLFYHRTFLVISLHFAVMCHLNDLVKASSNLKWTKRSFQWFHSISLLNFSLNFHLGCCLYKLCFDSLWITHPNSWTLAKYGHISIKVFSEHFLKANLPCIGWKAGFVS